MPRGGHYEGREKKPLINERGRTVIPGKKKGETEVEDPTTREEGSVQGKKKENAIAEMKSFASDQKCASGE